MRICKGQFEHFNACWGFIFFRFFFTKINHKINKFREKNWFFQNSVTIFMLDWHLFFIFLYLGCIIFISKLLVSWLVSILRFFFFFFFLLNTSDFGRPFDVAGLDKHTITSRKLISFEKLLKSSSHPWEVLLSLLSSLSISERIIGMTCSNLLL